MAEVRLENISKAYRGGETVVKDLNFTIQDKEFVVLVGPSGCGKSTTLRMIAGLEEITSGELYIDGKLMNNVSPRDRDIAMVFQNYALYPHMTVFENMAFGLKLRKYDKKEIDRRVREAAELLGIGEYLDRKPKSLSGGQRQRVAVGRAIVRKPKVFLFDEPLSNLDAKFRVQMRAELSRLHKKLEATIVYVTHDQVEAMTMGDKLVVMHKGVIQQTDTPLHLYNNPANKFVAGFIGSPAMNFLKGSLTTDCAMFISDGGTIRIELPLVKKEALSESGFGGRQFWVGIRPEDIHQQEGHINTEEHKTPKYCPIEVVLDMIELTGSEALYYFYLEGVPFCARIPAKEKPAAGKREIVFFNPEALQFFDVRTELALV